MTDKELLTREMSAAASMIAAARSVAVLTGAGISTDSGIPDFRGPEGIWTKNPAAERASNLQVYLSDPEVREANWQVMASGVWNQKRPNIGHRALVDLERSGRLHTLVTQNVDGLHLMAGTDPEHLVEIHGTVWRSMCLSCGIQAAIEVVLERVRNGELDPTCLDCGGLLKRATVSFGQSLFAGDLDRALSAAQEAEILLAVGTTLAVGPVNQMVLEAVRSGRPVVILNGGPTEMDELAEVVVQGQIGLLLPNIVGNKDLGDSPQLDDGAVAELRPDG